AGAVLDVGNADPGRDGGADGGGDRLVIEDADHVQVGAALIGRHADAGQVVVLPAGLAGAARTGVGQGQDRRVRRAQEDRHLLDAGGVVGRAEIDVGGEVKQVVKVSLLDVGQDDHHHGRWGTADVS